MKNEGGKIRVRREWKGKRRKQNKGRCNCKKEKKEHKQVEGLMMRDEERGRESEGRKKQSENQQTG